jgi:hypothetical protein
VRLDDSVALFYASLAMSAAAVVLFLWLMRAKGAPGAEAPPRGGSDRQPPKDAPAESKPPK